MGVALVFLSYYEEQDRVALYPFIYLPWLRSHSHRPSAFQPMLLEFRSGLSHRWSHCADVFLYLSESLFKPHSSGCSMYLTLFQDAKWIGLKLTMTVSKFNAESVECTFPWKWSHEHIKYLGVLIPCKCDDAYKINYLPIILKLKAILQDGIDCQLPFLKSEYN